MNRRSTLAASYCCDLIAAIAIALLGACRAEGDDGGSVPATTTDSAGVEIVSNARMADVVLTLDAPEDSVLRDEGGEPYIFTSVSEWTVRVTGDGAVYVVMPQDAALLIFDSVGRLERRIGHRGGGPGELRQPLAVLTAHDTVLVYDPIRLAVLRWTTRGTASLPELRVDADDQAVRPLLIDGDGILGLRREEGDDSVVVTVGHRADSAPPISVRQPAGKFVPLSCLPMPVRRMPLLSPTVHASSFEGIVATSTGADYEISLLERGRRVRLVRRDVAPRMSDSKTIRLAAGRGVRASLGGLRCVVDPVDLAALAGAAPTVPAVHGITVLGDLSLFVQRTLAGESTQRVDYFDHSGVYKGTLRGVHLPLGRLPDGRLLIPRPDEESGGYNLALIRIR